MDEKEILKLWSVYDKKLEETLSVNRMNVEGITRLKIKSVLASMQPLKVFTLVAGIMWVAFGGVIVVAMATNAYAEVSKFFLFSAGIQLLLTAMAVWVYLYQLIIIQQVDITEPILQTQETLQRLKSSTLLVARLLFLQLPLWTTFYITDGMLAHGNIYLLMVQALVTLSATSLAVWLFINIKFENRHKKWFQLLFSGNEWTPVIKAFEFVDDLQAYKGEDQSKYLTRK